MALVGDFSGSSSIGQATTIPTPADHATRLAAAVYTGLDRTNVQADTKVATLATTPAAAVDGEITLNTTDINNGPTLRMSIYDATAAVHIELAECVYSVTTPAAGYNIPGMLWRDCTLHMWRRYESATTAPNGVAGWHPVDAAYQLWKNEVGSGSVAAGDIVIEKIGGTDGLRAFTTSALEKNQQVLGVAMETIADTAYGVIALVSGGATVLISVLGLTFGAVAKGDVIVQSTTAAKGREAGPLAGTVTPAAGTNYIGLQRGGFAVALAAQAADATVKCRLLGQVGTGMLVLHSAGTIWSDTTPPTAFTSIDVRKAASGSNGAQGAVALEDASHAPLVSWQGLMQLTGTSGSYTRWSLDFDKNGSGAVNHSVADNAPDMGANAEYDKQIPLPMIPCSDSAGTLAGNEIQLKYTADSGSVTWSAFLIQRTGYIC